MFHYSKIVEDKFFILHSKSHAEGEEAPYTEVSVVVLVVLHEPFFICVNNCANRRFILYHLFLSGPPAASQGQRLLLN